MLSHTTAKIYAAEKHVFDTQHQRFHQQFQYNASLALFEVVLFIVLLCSLLKPSEHLSITIITGVGEIILSVMTIINLIRLSVDMKIMERYDID